VLVGEQDHTSGLEVKSLKISKIIKMIRKISLIVLFALGAFQLALGLLIGRVRIKTIEGVFWNDLGLVADQSRVFTIYMSKLQSHWDVLTWLGILTIIATSALTKGSIGKS
jgi:hypothetical protein